ncbi:MAG: hypothetical protein KF784_02245 [Fimbriimonadaceae bacterium]|nr:hypothetical protein [Fimbriimonadaceae bacterium]
MMPNQGVYSGRRVIGLVYGPPAKKVELDPVFMRFAGRTETERRKADPRTLEGAMAVVDRKLGLKGERRKIVREFLVWGGEKVTPERLERAVHMAQLGRFDVMDDFNKDYRRAKIPLEIQQTGKSADKSTVTKEPGQRGRDVPKSVEGGIGQSIGGIGSANSRNSIVTLEQLTGRGPSRKTPSPFSTAAANVSRNLGTGLVDWAQLTGNPDAETVARNRVGTLAHAIGELDRVYGAGSSPMAREQIIDQLVRYSTGELGTHMGLKRAARGEISLLDAFEQDMPSIKLGIDLENEPLRIKELLKRQGIDHPATSAAVDTMYGIARSPGSLGPTANALIEDPAEFGRNAVRSFTDVSGWEPFDNKRKVTPEEQYGSGYNWLLALTGAWSKARSTYKLTHIPFGKEPEVNINRLRSGLPVESKDITVNKPIIAQVIRKAALSDGAIQIVKVDTKIFGSLNDPESVFYNARSYIRHKIPENLKVTIKSTGEEIEVSKSGYKHGTAHKNPKKMVLVPYIKSLMENARYLYSVPLKPGQASNVVAFHIYGTLASDGSNLFSVILRVKEYTDGRRFLRLGRGADTQSIQATLKWCSVSKQ